MHPMNHRAQQYRKHCTKGHKYVLQREKVGGGHPREWWGNTSSSYIATAVLAQPVFRIVSINNARAKARENACTLSQKYSRIQKLRYRNKNVLWGGISGQRERELEGFRIGSTWGKYDLPFFPSLSPPPPPPPPPLNIQKVVKRENETRQAEKRVKKGERKNSLWGFLPDLRSIPRTLLDTYSLAAALPLLTLAIGADTS